jgi:PIN domain nuclease of toxin-antitoxin system
MRLLLDTHVFLWFISGNARLIPDQHALRDPANDVYLSVVSLWEATVKHSLGKLPLPDDPAVYVPTMRQRHAIECLPLDEGSVMRLSDLPDFHRDPFDRMLICQALHHGLTLVTADKKVAAYTIASICLI